MKLSGPLHLNRYRPGAYASTSAVVPSRAGECRLVRVIPVLIFTDYRGLCWFCAGAPDCDDRALFVPPLLRGHPARTAARSSWASRSA